MKRCLSLVLSLVLFTVLGGVAGATEGVGGAATPLYCYKCTGTVPGEADYPCNNCWHPVTGPQAVISCIPYCNGTCSVGVFCDDLALRDPVLQPDGSRLDFAFHELVNAEGGSTNAVEEGEFFHRCGGLLAAETLDALDAEIRDEDLLAFTI